MCVMCASLSIPQIEDLEKQLIVARSEAQSERDMYSQEAGNLDEQVQQLAVGNGVSDHIKTLL